MPNTQIDPIHYPEALAPTIKVKILCVDDQVANLISLQAALDTEDYEIIEAKSGEEAIEIVRNEDFAVILLDVQMPGIDGFQTAQNIRQLKRSKHTPIIFLTANYPNEQHALQGYEVGAVDYLFKPLNLDVLRAKVAVFADLFRTKVDIHHLKEVQMALTEAVRVRDEFLSIASHELKTPITPLQLQMQGFIRMIETGKLETTPAEKLKYMVEISDSQVSRLARLIDQLLDVSRINEGRLSIQSEATNLAEVVYSVIEQLQHELDASECKILLNLDRNVYAYLDRLRIEQVIINLITNSMKYASGKPIEVRLTSNHGNAILSVKDYGIGISPSDQKRIFDRFERAVPAKNYGGLGLGLYISKQIVELHDGEIWVESSLGEGSTFYVQLPLHSSHA